MVTYSGANVPGRPVQLTSQVTLDTAEGEVPPGYENAAPLDHTSGVTDANGTFVTIQRWMPPNATAHPNNYHLGVKVILQ